MNVQNTICNFNIKQHTVFFFSPLFGKCKKKLPIVLFTNFFVWYFSNAENDIKFSKFSHCAKDSICWCARFSWTVHNGNWEIAQLWTLHLIFFLTLLLFVSYLFLSLSFFLCCDCIMCAYVLFMITNTLYTKDNRTLYGTWNRRLQGQNRAWKQMETVFCFCFR